MSLFNRIAGTNPEDRVFASGKDWKISVWPLMMDVTRLLDGKISFADLATEYDLNGAEQTQMQSYLGAINTMLQAEIAPRVSVGLPLDVATRDARLAIDGVLRYVLLMAEYGKITEAEFNSQLGL